MQSDSTITRPAKIVAETVSVLVIDPDLAADLDPGEAEEARRSALARVVALEPGPASSMPGGPGDLGLLVLSGLLIRTVGIEDRRFAELLGPGDLLRPWDQSATLVPHESAFRVMEPTRVAVLDRRFAYTMAAWPPVLVALVARTMQRARSLAMHLAVCHMRGVEQRLLVALWHLADRWGRVALDRLPVRDEDDRLPLQKRAQRAHAVAEIGEQDGHHGDRPDRQRRPGDRVVALGDALLDEVARDHEQDEVEGLQRPELALSH